MFIRFIMRVATLRPWKQVNVFPLRSCDALSNNCKEPDGAAKQFLIGMHLSPYSQSSFTNETCGCHPEGQSAHLYKKEVSHRWRRWKMKTDLFWEDSDWNKVRRHSCQHQYPRKIRCRFVISSYVKVGVATDITVWRWLTVNWENVQKSVSAQICNSNKWTEKKQTSLDQGCSCVHYILNQLNFQWIWS